MVVPVKADHFPAFTFSVTGSESEVLKIVVAYDGSDRKYGNQPLQIDEYWVIQPPSPCYKTVPPSLVFPEGDGFDWCFAPFGIPVGEIVIEETSSHHGDKLQLLIYCASRRDPKTLEMWEGCVLMRK